jgi:hypothetical protein
MTIGSLFCSEVLNACHLWECAERRIDEETILEMGRETTRRVSPAHRSTLCISPFPKVSPILPYTTTD